MARGKKPVDFSVVLRRNSVLLDRDPSQPVFPPRFHRLLASAVLLQIHAANAGVWARYSFDTDFSDVSGNARHGTLTDAGSTGNSGIVHTPGDFKFGGGAMHFHADRDFIAIPSKTFASGSPYTIAFWARKTAGDTGQAAEWDMVLGQRDNANFFIALNDATGTGLRWRSSSSAAERQADFAVPKDYEWHHYAVVASGTSLTLYRDGALSGTATGKQTGFILDTLGEAYSSSSDYDFNGQLDEVWIFDEALDADRVAALRVSNTPEIAPSTVSKLRVILQAGQSNADGRASISGLPAALQSPQADVDLFYRVEGGSGSLTSLQPGLSETSQFGPEIVLGRKLADLHAHEQGTRVAILKYANGGTDLNTKWKAGGDASTSGDGPDYTTFQQTVSEGLAALALRHPQATLQIDAMVWMQGESDAVAGSAALYQTNLARFIADARATYGASLPFIIGRLSSQQTALDATYLAQVRAAQQAVAAADPRTSFFSTDGFAMNGDNLHFSAAGQQAMGAAFADGAAYAAWVSETFSAGDIDAGRAEPDADADGDGQSNRSEFLGASNPHSGDSRFLAAVNPTTPGNGTISYLSSLSRFYAVEQWSEESHAWHLALPYLQGVGGTTTRNLTLAAPRGIYRVASRLP